VHEINIRKSGSTNTGLVKIILTVMDYSRKIRENNDLKDRIRTVVSSIPREMFVRALNGTVVAGYCVLNRTGNRLRPSCRSSCTYHVCFVNKSFLQFKC
jgi:hypothetical protein